MEKSGFPNLERRKYPRHKDNILILCSLKTSPNVKFKVFTCNISADGLSFETERNILKGNKLELELYQPVNYYKNMIFCMPVLAEVVWVKKIEKDNFEEGENKYKVGVKFLEIKEEDKGKIAEYVLQNNVSEK